MSDPSARLSALATDPPRKLLVRFAVPSVASMLVVSLYNVVDQLYVGHSVGYLGNAATNVVFPLNLLTIAVSMMVGEGAAALYSILQGEKKGEEAKSVIGCALVTMFGVGIVFALSCFLALRPLLRSLGATETIMPYALDYATPILWGIPFLVCAPGLNGMIRANGSPRYALFAIFGGAVMNILLNTALIFGFGMGVKGAGIGTARAQFFGFCISMRYLAIQNRFSMGYRHLRFLPKLAGRILACGLPASLAQLSVSVVLALLNHSLGRYGATSGYGAEIPLAVVGIAIKVNQIFFSVLMGIAIGSQPIIGFNFGAGLFLRVRETFFLCLGTAACAGVAATLAFVFFPENIISLFGEGSEMYREFGARCFRIFLSFTFLNALSLPAGAFFQSMARVRVAVLIQLARQFIFMAPLVFLLPSWFGLDGVLLAGPVADILTVALAAVLVVRELRRLGTADIAQRRC